MKITSTKFIKGLVGDDSILADGVPQIAFIGRSNVGKSSLINTLTKSSASRTSSFPGRTQEINVFLVKNNLDNSFYFIDLPGYGFARASGLGREKIGELIDSYLFNSIYTQKKVVLIIDASIGMTEKDILMFNELIDHQKNFIVVANKVDRLKQSDYHKRMEEIKKMIGNGYPIIPFSNKTKKDLDTLVDEIFR
jgi:GTP-binding protein